MDNIGIDTVTWVALVLGAICAYLALRGLFAIYKLYVNHGSELLAEERFGELAKRTAFYTAPAILFFFAAFIAYGTGTPPQNTYTGAGSEEVTEQLLEEERARPDAAPAPVPEYEKDHKQIQEESDRALEEKLKKYKQDGGTK